MGCRWAPNQELKEACKRFDVCCFEDPMLFAYSPTPSILQSGPQCGLVALAMCKHNATGLFVKMLYDDAKNLGYTINGELFSARYMQYLAASHLLNRVKFYEGNLMTDEIINFLLNKGKMLVPYDCDANHSPCSKRGHKAHWGLVTGIVITRHNKPYVIVRHGKSKYLGVWALQDLADSNAQLEEFSPCKKTLHAEYVLPEGGLAGPSGLKNKAVLIENL